MSSKLGNFFFKIRSFTPVPFILALLYYAKPIFETALVGILFVVIGEFLRIWAVGYAGGATRATSLGAARDLVTTGPYSYVRNPLYLGNLLLSLGICIFANVLWLIPILIVGYLIQYLPIITVEEVYLLASCGPTYQTYQEQVPRFLPQIQPYPNQSDHDFSWTRAINSEKRTLTAIVCVIALIFTRQLISI